MCKFVVAGMEDKTKNKNAAKTASGEQARNKEKPLSEKEIKALHQRLDMLRAEDEANPPKPVQRSVRAMVAYAACDFGVNEQVVRAAIEQEFGCYDEQAEIGSDYYNELVHFLAHLNIKMLLH